MATKHTDGPWIHGKADEIYRDGDRLVWTSKGPGYGTVAEASSYHREAVANARLIGASPELLMALEQLHDAVKDDRVQTRHMTNAVDAIAKATGKAVPHEH